MIILASASPRRRELLTTAGVAVAVLPAHVPEAVSPGENAAAMVQRLADAKARAVATVTAADPSVAPGAFVLGADTTVTRQGHILEKPADADDARTMLRLLAGGAHQVLTGWALWRAAAAPERLAAGVASTDVEVRAMTDQEIEGYLSTGEWTDKAGAYAIQGFFSAFIRGVHGSYANVVGLPVCTVVEALGAAGAFADTGWPSPATLAAAGR